MNTSAARRSFTAQLASALARTTPAYTAGPLPGRSIGGQILAALGRRAITTQRPPQPDLSPTVPARVGSSATAQLLLSSSPETRVRLRSHPAVLSTAMVLQIQLARLTLGHTIGQHPGVDLGLDIRDLARARDLAHELASDRVPTPVLNRDLARDLSRALALDLALDLELDRELKSARDIARDLFGARDRVLELAHALTRVRDVARRLARGVVRDLGHALARDFGLVLVRPGDRTVARDLARDLDVVLDLARDLDLGPDLGTDRKRVLGRDLARARAVALARGLDSARSDFMGIDLSDAELTGLPLAGVRWSRTTRWPSVLVDRVEQVSVEIMPGIFEIQGGTAHADTSAVLVNA